LPQTKSGRVTEVTEDENEMEGGWPRPEADAATVRLGLYLNPQNCANALK